MRVFRGVFLFAILAVSGVPALLSAQYPGQELIAPYEQVRAQYVAMMYREVLPVISRWRESIERADLKALTAMLETDALYSPVEGWIARDRREAADSLGSTCAAPSPWSFF
jgi:hypothetical protein